MTVTRYRVRCKDGLVTRDTHGAWVDYNDYAKLEARLVEAERLLAEVTRDYHITRTDIIAFLRPADSASVQESVQP